MEVIEAHTDITNAVFGSDVRFAILFLLFAHLRCYFYLSDANVPYTAYAVGF